MRLLAAALVSVVLLLSLPHAGPCDPQPVKIVVDGQPVGLNPPSYLEDGSIRCPAAAYMEALGATVSYDRQQSFVMGIKFGRAHVFYQDERIAFWGEERIQFDDPPAYVNGVMYVPMRFVAEKLGYRSSWSRAKLTVTLTSIPFTARTAKVFLDGTEMRLPAPSYFDAGVLICPAEAFLGQLGALVSWYADSRTIAAERRGIQLTAVADQQQVGVNGQAQQIARGLGVINGLPYVPAEFWATTLRYGYRWDQAAMTAHLTTDPLTSLSETRISDQGWRDPKLHAIPGGGLMVIARKAAPDRDIIFAVGSAAGENWQATARREPFGVAAGEFDGFALSANELFCYSGIIVNAANIDDMPIWWARPDGQWQQASVPGADRRASRRFVTSVVMSGALIYAAGYEVLETAMIGQLWRSADRGMTWTPLCDGNGHLRGGSATMAPGTAIGLPQPVGGGTQTLVQLAPDPIRSYDVYAAGPDGTVWGRAGSDQLLRLEPGGSAGLVPFPKEDLQDIVDVEAPTNTDVCVLTLRAPRFDDRQHSLTVSSDRGATWADYSLGQPHSAPLLVRFASPGASVMARDCTAVPGAEAWEMTITRSDWRTSYDSMSLSGHNVLDLLMPSTERALILAHKVNPKLLYLLRWDVLP